MSRILSTAGGGVIYPSMHLGRHPPVQCMLGYAPTSGQTPPRADTPLGRHPPGRHPWGRHSQADTPWVETPRQTPPWAETPPGRHPPYSGQTPPPDSYCSGQHASYWNAFLFMFYVCCLQCFSWKRNLRLFKTHQFVPQ